MVGFPEVLPSAARVGAQEYLVSHGSSGGFGRFLAPAPLVLQRGQRVVLRTARGLEVGEVLCPANQRHQALLATEPVDEVLRPVTEEDEQVLHSRSHLGQQLFDLLRSVASERNLPIEILDVQVAFDGRRAVVQYLARAQVDLETLTARVASSPLLFFENLAEPLEVVEEEHGGCGKPDCGRSEGGGCSSCGTGGCSSCGSGKVDLRPYFTQLRGEMEERQRTPLL